MKSISLKNSQPIGARIPSNAREKESVRRSAMKIVQHSGGVMKKFYHTGKYILYGILFAVLLSANTALSHAEEKIHSIDIFAVLQEDGSMDIRQTWDVSSESGTEYYLSMHNLRSMQIENFRVKDKDGVEFRTLPYWNIERSLKEKAYTCGIVQKNRDVELCWGKGFYGRQKYILEYKVTNVIKSYPEAEGFIFRFIPKDMNLPIEKTSLRIVRAGDKKISSDTVSILGFGYIGRAEIKDGVAIAKSNFSLDRGSHFTVLMKFPKGSFYHLYNGEGTFSELEVQAKQNSDVFFPKTEQVPTFFERIRPFFIAWGIRLGIPAGILYVLRKKRKFEAPLLRQYKRRGTSYAEVEYCRRIPFRGFLDQTAFALHNGGEMIERKDMIGAYILRMVKDKALVLRKTVDSDFFGGDRERVYFEVDRHAMIEDPATSDLFDLIVSAAGSDNVLQPGELRGWAVRNAEKLNFWFQTTEVRGERGFRFKEGYYVHRLSTFFGKTRGYVLTDKGVEMIEQALGFKKFLEDFTLLSERETKELKLWDEYLIFAALFGIADRIAEEMKTIYPKNNFEIDLLSAVYFAKKINDAIQSGYLASEVATQYATMYAAGVRTSGFGFGGGSR